MPHPARNRRHGAMSETSVPADSKLTATKRRWASEGRFITGESRNQDERLPPGQHLVRTWPVLDLGIQPVIELAQWRLDITGAVEKPQSLTWEAMKALPQGQSLSDIHCVTSWSRYDNHWEGVLSHDLLDHVMPKDEVKFVAFTSHDGYTTNMPFADFAAPTSILAHGWEGMPLSVEHGGPLRLVVAHLYFWKSPKWLNRIEFLAEDRPGFWERNGYHDYGDPWRQQRYQEN
jgi:DMSO/TMAO reductase YedYZ molybdopterin-dependent catalytic subunit